MTMMVLLWVRLCGSSACGAGETRRDLLIRVKLALPFTPKAHCALARDGKQQLCCRVLSVLSLSTSLSFARVFQKRVWIWPRCWLEAQSKLALLGPCSESFGHQRNLLPLLLPKAPLQRTLKRSGNDKFHTQLCSELYWAFLIRKRILMCLLCLCSWKKNRKTLYW